MKRKKNVMWLLVLMMIVISFVPCTVATAAETEEQTSSDLVLPDNLSFTGYDVVFCIDNSKSVWSQQAVRDQAVRSICNLAVGADIRVGAVYFANDIYKTMGLTSVETKEGSQQVQAFLNLTEQNKANLDTNIGNALAEARGLLENQDSSRKKVVILFSDGINENLAQDDTYKDSANALTEQQVQLLEEEGVTVYCVFLEKDRNDESYLRDLVNYFDSDNQYDSTRFKKTTESEIGALSEQFAQIFYSMQNNMKYRNITLDSTGTTSFYVPDMGIEKLQIYLNNSSAYEATLENSLGNYEGMESWADGGNSYFTVENPVEGEWTLKVTGDNIQNVKGTIAYYAYVSAELDAMFGWGSIDALKNKEQTLRLRLFNKDGVEILPNDEAVVEATVNFTTESGEAKETKLLLKNDGSMYTSEEFTFDDYGAYKIRARVTYDDLIDFSYVLTSGTVQGAEPYVYDKNQKFYSTKTEKGEVFKMDASQLYHDPEGEKVTIKKVSQLEEANPVEVVMRDDVVTFTAKQTGDIGVKITVEDASGLMSTVTVEGKVVNKTQSTIMKTGLIIGAIVLIVLIVISVIKNKNRKVEIASEKRKFEEIQKQVGEEYEKFKQIYSSTDEYAEVLSSAVEKINHMAAKVPEGLQRVMGVQQFADSKYVNSVFAEVKRLEKEIQENMSAVTKDALYYGSHLQKNAVVSGSVLKRCKTLRGNADKALTSIVSNTTQYQEEVKGLDCVLDELYKKYQELEAVINKPITCDLHVNINGIFGSKSCRGGKLKGAYGLDDVSVFGGVGGTVKDVLLMSTNIYVCGYEKAGEKGLVLKCTDDFGIKNQSEGANFTTVNEAVLLCGERYEIKPAGRSDKKICVEVE